MKPGTTIYFTATEQYWDKPFVMKRHHVYDTRSVLLQGKLIEIRGKELKVELFGNNGFEMDGESIVIHEGKLLCNQNFTLFAELGKWKPD